jgi:hypothetical protein
MEEKSLVDRCNCYFNGGYFLLKTHLTTSVCQIKDFTVSSLLRGPFFLVVVVLFGRKLQFKIYKPLHLQTAITIVSASEYV